MLRRHPVVATFLNFDQLCGTIHTHTMKNKKTALITGASSGIGREFASILAREGYNLVLVVRSLHKITDLIEELDHEYQREVTAIEKDLSKETAAEEIVTAIKERDITIDCLINNAGFGDYGFFHKSDIEKTREMMQVNMVAVTELTRLLLPAMVKKGSGAILNVASTAAFQPGPLMAVYYATKAYVLSFSEALANELQGTGVTVTALCPGPTNTQFEEQAALEESKLFKNIDLATPRDVAEFGYSAMKQGKPVAIHGWKNWMMAQSVRFTPRSMVTTIVRKMQEEVEEKN